MQRFHYTAPHWPPASLPTAWHRASTLLSTFHRHCAFVLVKAHSSSVVGGPHCSSLARALLRSVSLLLFSSLLSLSPFLSLPLSGSYILVMVFVVVKLFTGALYDNFLPLCRQANYFDCNCVLDDRMNAWVRACVRASERANVCVRVGVVCPRWLSFACL
jgi:hypothetical protein